jgi:hypothetical protein
MCAASIAAFFMGMKKAGLFDLPRLMTKIAE